MSEVARAGAERSGRRAVLPDPFLIAFAAGALLLACAALPWRRLD